MMPFWAARMMTGSASASAAWARPRSPVAMASSIFTTAVRKRERRALLTRVRRAICRVALRAELVLAIRGCLVRLFSMLLMAAGKARRQFAPLIEAARRGVKVSRSGDPLGPNAVIAGGCGRPVGRRIGRKRRLDARPARVAMDMGERCLHAGHELLAVEQLADRDCCLERRRIAALPRPGAQV